MSTAKKQQGKTSVSGTLPPFPHEVPERDRFIEVSNDSFDQVIEPKLRHIETINLRRNGKQYKAEIRIKYNDELHAKIYHSEAFDMFFYIRETEQLFCLSGEAMMKTAHLIDMLRAEQDLLIIGDQPK